jgi:hypothetical protein
MYFGGHDALTWMPESLGQLAALATLNISECWSFPSLLASLQR